LVACTITLPATIVVPLTVPRTRTFSPFLTDVVEDALVTVTSCPAGVVRVKLDVDTPSMVPSVPPAAGPERALEPPLLGAGRPEGGVVVAVAVAEPLPAVALTMP
jgi:hypothetical protein